MHSAALPAGAAALLLFLLLLCNALQLTSLLILSLLILCK